MHTVSSSPVIFNRALLRKYRDRAAARLFQHQFLLEEVWANIAERLQESTRAFPIVLEMGCRLGGCSSYLAQRAGTRLVVQSEMSAVMLTKAQGMRIMAEEEYLPFAPGSFDLVLSIINLHAVNDLPGALIQLRKALKPGGVFIAALLGGDTLTELRQSLMAAEMECGRGVTPHIFPFVDMKDAGMLMQRAGFALPVADSYTLVASYEGITPLMHDIRGMGEGNILITKKNYGLSREVLAHAGCYYQQHFNLDEGRIQATFEIITITGMGV